ncbi:hypothetical protein B0T14DRAFT_467071 [Immersiella caudata]|uniref:Prephenate dehydratase domain-containing protein n=1 Tax=Immersiella caudata TaxID=314043 RepID=A0AA40CCK3_9PEZI|nr:hypothetical protein B0T14DRAFT_467071 [Immersiella caudata]
MAAPTVCTTPVCLEAASTMLSQMALNWEKIDPCTDFEQMMCHRFPLLNEPDMSPFRKLGPRHKRVLEGILQGSYQEAISEQLVSWTSTFPTNAADEANFNMIKRAYAACMDTDTIEKAGTKPLVDLIASVNSLWPINTGDLKSKVTKADHAGLADVMSFLEELGISTFQKMDVSNNPWDPTLKTIYMTAPPPLKDNVTEYQDPEAMLAYANSTSQMLAQYLPGNATAEMVATIAEDVVALDVAIAGVAVANVPVPNSIEGAYNLTLKEAADFYGLDKVVKSLAPEYNQPIIVMPKQILANFSEIIASHPKVALQAYLLVRAIHTLSIEVDSTASGNGKSRSDHCLAHLTHDLRHILGRFFVASTYPDSTRKLAGEVANNIRSELKTRISQLTWMSDDAKTRAAKKVDNMVQSLGYYSSPTLDLKSPESLASYYKTLNITANYFDNVLAKRLHQLSQQMAATSKPADRLFTISGGDAAWEINAAYAPFENTITLSSGMFQSPLFSDQLPGYVSYSTLGGVVGHEIVHGFDSAGRLWNENAQPFPWWDNKTVAAYEERAQCFVKQYSEFTYPITGGKTANTDGEQTLGENISDAGGLQLAFKAWKKTQEGKKDASLPGLEKFTHEQLFFMFFASGWCNSYTPKHNEESFATDVHAHDSQRIMGTTANSRAFREAFNCKVKEPACEIF